MGVFYTLMEAHIKGLLTQNDLKSIAYYHNGGRNGNEDKIEETFVPLAKNPEVLTEEVEKKIKQTHLNIIQESDKDATIDGVFIKAYYGVYNGYVAIVISDSYTIWTPGVRLDIISGGIKFNFNHGLLLWKAD